MKKGEKAHNFKDISGMKFNKLLVINLNIIKNNEVFWNCVCDCGNKCIKRSKEIRHSLVKSCGCLVSECRRLKPGVTGFNCLYNDYKRGAEKRKLTFFLTKEEFKILTKQNCHYCKIEPKHINISNSSKASEATKANSAYIYNGIDRLDNNVGYELYNCVSCCSICNRGKHTMSYQEFMGYIERFK